MTLLPATGTEKRGTHCWELGEDCLLSAHGPSGYCCPRSPSPLGSRTQLQWCRRFGESSDLSWLLICNGLRVHAVVSVYEHSAALSSANSIHQLLDRLGE